jgi:two-component system CheB/CheR fusion protein
MEPGNSGQEAVRPEKVDKAVDQPVPSTNHKPESCVVGVGASAGGLDALRAFFSRMPATPGFACVVVVHLSPEHESHLVELLQPYTQMPVCQVVETTALEPNRVYVIPPNANLSSIDTHLRLSELEVRRINRAPIDHFLRTLAETHGETAIGVILSGAGSDGALGIRQIKEHGGLTIAQNPAEAEYNSMPQCAIATGTVDLVLSVLDMAEEIAGYCDTRPDVAVPGAHDTLIDNDASLLAKILGEVRLRTGQEFAMYRQAVVLRRVRQRMRLHRVNTLAEYFQVLHERAQEARALHNDLLLNVTEFFRDVKAYQTLELALAEILDRKDMGDGHVRVWSIGCSTGEEAYSLAILLVEQASRHSQEPWDLQVFASEFSPNALQQAREGMYPQEVAASISPERLARFFVQENGRYRVRRELRDVVTFASHNLFRDPPYSHLDLIVCRDLLCNLQPQMRNGVVNLFAYALEPQGMLLVGPGDEIEMPDLFTRDRSSPRLLRRVSGPKRPLKLPPEVRPFARLSGEYGGAPVMSSRPDTGTLFRAAIERYTPPSVMIDANNQVVHFSSTAARYVHIPGGELTLDILKLAPEVIAYRLRRGLAAVRKELRSWQSEPFAIAAHGTTRRMTVRIDPADPSEGGSELLLVIFDDTVEPLVLRDGSDVHAVKEVLQLQTELARAHEQLAALGTQLAAATPENRAAQWQRQEELRSVVEELEITREELQAVNEEVVSLNDENRYRIEALSQLSNDLQHLLESTGLATLLVDRSMRVVRFTPLVEEIFNIKATDVGRPLIDLTHRLRYGKLTTDLLRVIEDLAELELEVESEDGRWFLMRLQPYRSALRGLEGAVLVLIDISARKRAELALREADRRKDEFLAVLAHELRNPLAPIGAGIEVLRKAPENAEVVQQITATMARQMQQLVRLVDDLLEVGRISGGKLTLRIKPVQIAEVSRDAVAAVRPAIDKLEHELTVTLPEEPLIVDGDAARLTQVIANLLHNAARYTSARGQIGLTVRRAGDQVLISVRDNGQGIAPKSLPNVFEMFYQVSRSDQLSNSGLGVGLSLAKKLVEMHSGTISVESPGLNMGSTFTVGLPLASASGASPTADAPRMTSACADKRRVLIVDDNADAAETLRVLLTMIGGGEVQTASSGVEALKVGAQLRPNVVLLDLGMPGMDGYEVARRMRGESWGKDALLVALTGWGQDQYRRRSSEAGFDRHMTKPADPEALRAVLSRVPAH